MSNECHELFLKYHRRAIRQAEAALRKTTDWNESARLMYLIDYHEAALNRIGREADSADRRKVSA